MKSYFCLFFLLLLSNVAFAESAPISANITTKNDLATLQKTWRCAGCDLRKIDLSHFSSLQLSSKNDPTMADCSLDLLVAEADFSYAILNHANFTACARGMVTPFRSIDFSYTNLTHAQLNDSVFYGVSFVYSNLPEAQLARTQLHLSDFTQANFSHAHLNQAQSTRDAMHGWGSNFYLTNFCSADLTQANLYGYFKGANFSLAQLNNATLTTSMDAVPTNIPHQQKLTSADLWAGTNFKDADLTGAHFYDADNKPADLSRAVFCRTIMPDGNKNNRDCK